VDGVVGPDVLAAAWVTVGDVSSHGSGGSAVVGDAVSRGNTEQSTAAVFSASHEVGILAVGVLDSLEDGQVAIDDVVLAGDADGISVNVEDDVVLQGHVVGGVTDGDGIVPRAPDCAVGNVAAAGVTGGVGGDQSIELDTSVADGLLTNIAEEDAVEDQAGGLGAGHGEAEGGGITSAAALGVLVGAANVQLPSSSVKNLSIGGSVSAVHVDTARKQSDLSTCVIGRVRPLTV